MIGGQSSVAAREHAKVVRQVTGARGRGEARGRARGRGRGARGARPHLEGGEAGVDRITKPHLVELFGQTSSSFEKPSCRSYVLGCTHVG